MDEPDDDALMWAALEAQLEFSAYARRSFTLSPEQCQQIHEFIAQHRDRRAGPDRDAEAKSLLAAEFSWMLEAEDGCAEAAINAVGKRFRMGRSSVFTARSRWQPARDAGILRMMSPEEWARERARFYDRSVVFEFKSRTSGR